jgi:hypothetical protein
MFFFLHTSFDVGLFFSFILTIIYHERDNVVISKFIISPLIFKNWSKLCNKNLIKVYCNMDNLKIDNVNVEYDYFF